MLSLLERLQKYLPDNRHRQPPQAPNEYSASAFLLSLKEADRAFIEEFLQSLAALAPALNDTKIAVVATGSFRQQPSNQIPSDHIFLRILNSQPARSPQRVKTVKILRKTVIGYLQQFEIDFKEFFQSSEDLRLSQQVFGDDVDQVNGNFDPILDYNDNPTFLLKGQGGPIYIIIAGFHTYPLDQFLEVEKRAGRLFAVLLQT